MRGVDQDIIGQLGEATHGVELRAAELVESRRTQQVGAADTAGEQRPTGEHGAGSARAVLQLPT